MSWQTGSQNTDRHSQGSLAVIFPYGTSRSLVLGECMRAGAQYCPYKALYPFLVLLKSEIEDVENVIAVFYYLQSVGSYHHLRPVRGIHKALSF